MCLTTGSYFTEETPVDSGKKGSLLSGTGLDAVAYCSSTRKLLTMLTTLAQTCPLPHSHICTDGSSIKWQVNCTQEDEAGPVGHLTVWDSVTVHIAASYRSYRYRKLTGRARCLDANDSDESCTYLMSIECNIVLLESERHV